MPTTQNDPRLVIPGWKGELWYGGRKLAQAPVWEIRNNYSDFDHRFGGDDWVYSIRQARSATLTLTETLMNDTVLFQQVLEADARGEVVTFDFNGLARGGNRTVLRLAIYEAQPTGDLVLLSVKTDGGLERPWTMRVNRPVEPLSYLSA